jgi:hypothetical protein
VAELAQFAFAPGSLLRFGQEAARKARPLVQDVAEKLRACEEQRFQEPFIPKSGRLPDSIRGRHIRRQSFVKAVPWSRFSQGFYQADSASGIPGSCRLSDTLTKKTWLG